MLIKTKPAVLSPYLDLYDKIIPRDHILRQIDELIDPHFINDALEDRYCLDNGRYCIPPVTMVKYLVLKTMYRLSDRDLVNRARTDMALKWFLDMAPEEEPVTPSLLSKFRKLRLKDVSLLDLLIDESVQVALKRGVMRSDSMLIVDGTHCKSRFRLMNSVEYLDKLARDLRKALYTCEGKEDWKKILPAKVTSGHVTDMIAYCRTLVETVRMSQSIVLREDITAKVNFLEEKVQDMEELLEEARKEAEAAQEAKKRASASTSGKQEARGKAESGESSKRNLEEAEKRLAQPFEPSQVRKQYSFDPDAGVGHKSADTSFWGYKAHIAMSDERIVTAVTITAGQANEGAQMKELVRKSRKAGMEGKVVVGDTAYSGKDNLRLAYSKDDPDGGFQLVSKLNPVTSAALLNQERDGFTYNKDAGLFVCPMGHMAIGKRRRSRAKEGKNSQECHYFNVSHCIGCPLDGKCHRKGTAAKVYTVTIPSELHKQQQAFQETEVFREAMGHRYKIEAKNSELKHRYGLETADSSGLFAMQIQVAVAVYASNLVRIARLLEAQKTGLEG